MNRRLMLVLMALNLLLAGLLATLWVRPDGTLRAIHWQSPVAIRPDLGSLAAAGAQLDDADLSRFMAILDRPLFSSSRRPPPPPPPPKVVVPVPPDPLNSMHLYGVFSGGGGGGVLAKVDGKMRRVKVSESIGEWSLKEIRPGAVVFSKAGESRVIPLVQARQGATASAPPRPAFAAPAAPSAAVPAMPAAPFAAPAPAAGSQPAANAAKPAPNPFVIGGSR